MRRRFSIAAFSATAAALLLTALVSLVLAMGTTATNTTAAVDTSPAAEFTSTGDWSATLDITARITTTGSERFLTGAPTRRFGVRPTCTGAYEPLNNTGDKQCDLGFSLLIPRFDEFTAHFFYDNPADPTGLTDTDRLVASRIEDDTVELTWPLRIDGLLPFPQPLPADIKITITGVEIDDIPGAPDRRAVLLDDQGTEILDLRVSSSNSVSFTTTTRAFTEDFTVKVFVPPPTPIDPRDGDRTSDNTPFFEWGAGSGDFDSYRLQVTSGDISAGPYDHEVVKAGTGDETSPPLKDAMYQWRVRTETGADARVSDFSEPVTFTVDTTPPGPPTLLLPVSGDSVNTQAITFSWSPSPTGATTSGDVGQYRLQVISGDTFNRHPILEVLIDHPATSATITLSGDTVYRSRVGAQDTAKPANETDPSTLVVQTFTLDTAPPAPPPLLSPTPDAVTADDTPRFDWAPSTSDDVASYLLQVTSGDISAGPFDLEKLIVHPATAYQVGTGEPLADGTYSWRVLAIDSAGNETPTGDLEVRQFTLDTTPPTTPAGLLVASFTDRRQVAMEWDRSTDVGTGVDFYNVFVDQQLVGTADDGACVGNICRFTTPTVSPGEHTFTVKAVDQVGNVSPSAELTSRIVLPWDLNEDGVVNAADLRIVAAALGISPPTDPRADVNNDRVVDIRDHALVALNFGRGD